MKIGDRLKILRKDYLKGISQDKFANRIGTTGAAISRYESADRVIPNSIILSICREFSVNEKWLREGEGEPFSESQTETLDKIAMRYHGSKTFRVMLDVYARLEPDQQDMVERFIEMLADEFAATGNADEVILSDYLETQNGEHAHSDQAQGG